MKKRVLATLLLASLLVVGCTDDASDITAHESATNVAELETEPDELTPDLPEDLKYNNVPFRVISAGGPYMVDHFDELELENMDIVKRANYDRAMMVEETLGVDFEVILHGTNDCSDVIRRSVSAGDNDYDLVTACANGIRSTLFEGLYLSVDDLPYVDIDKPWWNKKYMESVAVKADELNILFGPINHTSVQRSVCTVFNIDLLEKAHDLDAEDMYETVLAGEWTLDKFAELCTGAYNDVNGNTIADKEDIFSFLHSDYWSVDFMAYGAGVAFTERDDDGYPVMIINNERSVTLTEKLLSIFVNGNESFSGGTSTDCFELFGGGHAMFYVERFLALEKDVIRNSNVEYGIIPVPKLDETIDNYYTPIGPFVQWELVPITVENPAMISAVLELMAYDGYKNVTPTYYDVALKLKYTRGDDLDTASKMLDIITENQYTDFLAINDLAGMEQIFKRVVRSGENTFASTYASLESAANIKFQQMIDSYSAN